MEIEYEIVHLEDYVIPPGCYSGCYAHADRDSNGFCVCIKED